ncbi:auxin-responsive protein SAUR32 [Ricinus communis]|uniref:auxin-responsive protein SAUR32 n=1 Tax=Ricinus communis TaxID=3988 RepID=UPI000772284F|nr:auxin-responsive protein SAUR32 [Ricinus communis]|eukprot:XP_015572625.1 auxin-responsive protein SAUR32 [Ricinus communis]
MGSGDKNHLNFHIHLPHLQFHHHHHPHHQGKKELKDIPKGCLAILVGQGEEQQRFVIPVIYMNHPLFVELLKEAEEEYGFDQKGPITIPCHVEEFRNVQGMIDKENSHPDHHHQHPPHVLCFRV